MLTVRAAPQQIWMTHVRFGSKADMTLRNLDVRFTPKRGHRLSAVGCPLCADFVAEVGDDRCVATGANFFK
jgi:coenzyme F420-reducing hydrogenase beta subunit